MLKLTQYFPVLTKKSLTISLVAWVFICSILYGFAYLKERNSKAALIKEGVAISKDISSQSGLLLLERNIAVLSQLIEKITEKPEVVFASIIDHKNKLIAYTDQAQFLTLYRQKSGKIKDVQYWRVTDSDQKQVMNFSAEITFSETRVGEVFISLAAEKIGYLKRLISLLAVLSISIIILLYMITNYKALLGRLQGLNLKLKGIEEDPLHTENPPQFHCPMCGHQKPFTLNGFHLPDLETFFVLKGYPEKDSSLMLQDMARKKELKHLEHLISQRCAEIVKNMSQK